MVFSRLRVLWDVMPCALQIDREVSSKRWYPSTKLHGIISYNIIDIIDTQCVFNEAETIFTYFLHEF
jgi:hypothetical protein